MNIIFESQIYFPNLVNVFEKNSKNGLDYAAHNLCSAIYRGFKEHSQEISLVNVPNLGSYPLLYRKPRVQGISIDDGISLPFWNISYIKRFDIRRRLFKQIHSLLKRTNPGKTVLLLYNYRSLPFLRKLKEIYPNIKVCLIITDLPEFMMAPSSTLMKHTNKLFNLQQESSDINLEFVDGFVLLSRMMLERLNIFDKPWIQIEGIYNHDTSISSVEKEKDKTVLYTGDLGKRYGILNLVEAFHGIPDANYKLWLCGDGDGKEEILKYAQIDSRIHYKGILPRKKVLTLQTKATVLVNPRNSKDDYTKYSFPSKTMEYLASGTPVIMSHLSSIPEEYDGHIYYLDDESVEGMRNRIVEICSKSELELNEFGKKASDFIFKYKTEAPQVKRLLDFILSL